ncbi:hypothetical protein [Clostridium butyricum]|uniref:hypothetical protein n=1 Tax=Clostridium butyricum TaxID=1492 RepID=UPI000AE8C272|nr:hypothetical protein [Clostridium butyricum]
MGNKKFNEFYFENDRNYPDSVYWESFDKDRRATELKYDGHMFCPLCHSAPITVAKGAERRYLKVVKTDMPKHRVGCSYKLDEANKRETTMFYDDLNNADIRNRLVSCMNRMLKKRVRIYDKYPKTIGANEYNNFEFFNFITPKEKKKYLPHKNLLSKFVDEDFEIQKIFYGECDLYIKQYKIGNEVKRYYLRVMRIDKKYRICDISIPPYVYKYLDNILEYIPSDEKDAERYYICFSGILERKLYKRRDGKIGYSYSCALKDSRLISIEKSL